MPMVDVLGRKAKNARNLRSEPGQNGRTFPFNVPKVSAAQASGTRYQGNPGVKRRTPIVRAAPINGSVQGSPTGGCGDLGAQNLSGTLTRIISPTGEHLPADRHSSASSQSGAASPAVVNAAASARPEPTLHGTVCTIPPPPLPLALPVFNGHPLPAPPRQPSASSTSSRATSHAPSLLYDGPGPGYRLNVSAHSSFV